MCLPDKGLLQQLALSCLLWSMLPCHRCRKPVLVIALRGPGSDSFALRLLPVLEPETFPLSKLAPQRNNLRASAPAAQAPALPQKDAACLLPTPLYNAALLQVSLETVLLDVACFVAYLLGPAQGALLVGAHCEIIIAYNMLSILLCAQCQAAPLGRKSEV